MARYIDADKAKEAIINYGKGAINDGYKTLDPFDDILMISGLIGYIPTADVQEVRHGRWIEDKETGSLMCSECGHFTDEIIGDYISADAEIAEALRIPKGTVIHRSMKPTYCSKCGAKMDGKIKKG